MYMKKTIDSGLGGESECIRVRVRVRECIKDSGIGLEELNDTKTGDAKVASESRLDGYQNCLKAGWNGRKI